jgi:hypothetical protein
MTEQVTGLTSSSPFIPCLPVVDSAKQDRKNEDELAQSL